MVHLPSRPTISCGASCPATQLGTGPAGHKAEQGTGGEVIRHLSEVDCLRLVMWQSQAGSSIGGLLGRRGITPGSNFLRVLAISLFHPSSIHWWTSSLGTSTRITRADRGVQTRRYSCVGLSNEQVSTNTHHRSHTGWHSETQYTALCVKARQASKTCHIEEHINHQMPVSDSTLFWSIDMY